MMKRLTIKLSVMIYLLDYLNLIMNFYGLFTPDNEIFYLEIAKGLVQYSIFKKRI